MKEKHLPGDEKYNPSRRKLHIYDVIQQLISRNANCTILSCFISHTFIGELAESVDTPILNMMEGIHYHVAKKLPDVKKIGVLTSDYVKPQFNK